LKEFQELKNELKAAKDELQDEKVFIQIENNKKFLKFQNSATAFGNSFFPIFEHTNEFFFSKLRFF